MEFQKRADILDNRIVWIISARNNFRDGRTLLISKVSEAVLPGQENNHIGEGGTIDDFLLKQPGVRFVMNGGFSHYRKSFYDWPHQKFNVGDPVGLVKIRHHYYEDLFDIEDYGFFVQDEKKQPWKIVQWQDIQKTEKYILGCTPLLIFDGQPKNLPLEKMVSVQEGKVNPPSFLGHGMQKHARSAVGIKGADIYFVVVEGADASGGCTLPELQDIGMKLQLSHFMNLDGGGSSQFRIWTESGYIKNAVSPEDATRVLGHVIALFDEDLDAA